MLKNTAESPHLVYRPKRQFLFTWSWIGEVAKSTPSSAWRVRNDRYAAGPPAGITLNVPNVATIQIFIIAIAPRKQDSYIGPAKFGFLNLFSHGCLHHYSG